MDCGRRLLRAIECKFLCLGGMSNPERDIWHHFCLEIGFYAISTALGVYLLYSKYFTVLMPTWLLFAFSLTVL